MNNLRDSLIKMERRVRPHKLNVPYQFALGLVAFFLAAATTFANPAAGLKGKMAQAKAAAIAPTNSLSPPAVSGQQALDLRKKAHDARAEHRVKIKSLKTH